ncbi:DUF221-domain-containing protein [Clavulina sp. PMI_390]|nr:DUF221-domain-containing protein [Clavulina sp. PMI_390]
MSQSLLAWPMEVFRLDHDDIRRQNGLDAYVFVRFLRMMAYMLLPMWAISWAVLMPVTGIHGGGQTGLNLFTFGNVKPDNYPRYSAHLILAWLFTFWIFWVVRREMRHFITVRQRHLISPAHASSAQAKTILVTGVPPRYLQPTALKRLFSLMPGGVTRVWVNRDMKDIPDLWDERLAVINKLESAEVSLLNTATKLHNKREKALAKGKTPKEVDITTRRDTVDPEQPLTMAEKLVPLKERPSHRLKAISFLPFGLPFIGKKVDTIDWCRDEIVRLNGEVEEKQRACQTELANENSPIVTKRAKTLIGGSKAAEAAAAEEEEHDQEHYPRMNSAFIEFDNQVGAHVAAQVLAHHEPYRMAARYTDMAPEDVIWSNLNLNPYEAKIRKAISWAATMALVLLWAFPVAFVGAVSNVSALCVKFSWLHWICTLPSVVVGIISGLLPPVMLAVLMMLLPIVLRLLAKFEGIPSRSRVELSLMSRFFIFQVIHSFLIVSLSSGIINALAPLLNNPSSAANLLATNLPGASIFFLTYILLELSSVAGGFLQIVPLIVYYVKLFLLGSTPRSVYAIKNTMRSVQWGTLFPNIALLMVVTLAYSVLQPIINGMACVIFFLLYQLYKYLFLYQFDQPASSDTGGLFFPKAISQVFVGLYVEQVCLCALFFLQQDSHKKPSCIPEGALMIVLIIITAGFHTVLNDSYGPLLNSLPLSLVDRASQDEVNRSLEHPDDVNDTTPLREKGKASMDSTRPKISDTGVEEHELEAVGPARNGRTGLNSNRTTNGDSEVPHMADGENEAFERTGGLQDFTHPALQPARIIWLPQDTLGLSEEEVKDIRARGIEVTTRGAEMNEKGTVDVSTYPPGERPMEAAGSE